MKFAPRLFPRVPHRHPACSTRLPERLSRFAPFLLCSDVPTFSPVFNRLTVNSTVTFGRLHWLLAGFSACPATQFTVKPWRLPLLYHSIVPGAFRENRTLNTCVPRLRSLAIAGTSKGRSSSIAFIVLVRVPVS